jgi:hypothetical protein
MVLLTSLSFAFVFLIDKPLSIIRERPLEVINVELPLDPDSNT